MLMAIMKMKKRRMKISSTGNRLDKGIIVTLIIIDSKMTERRVKIV